MRRHIRENEKNRIILRYPDGYEERYLTLWDMSYKEQDALTKRHGIPYLYMKGLRKGFHYYEEDLWSAE